MKKKESIVLFQKEQFVRLLTTIFFLDKIVQFDQRNGKDFSNFVYEISMSASLSYQDYL